MKTLNVKLGDVQGTEVDANDIAPLNEKDIQMVNENKPSEEKENLKASARAKLVAGETLTEEEADTIVL